VATATVIVRTFNELAHLPRLIQGLSAQTITPAEIIVVDSGSTDGTREYAASVATKVVDIAPHEFSFGRALNRGISAATSDVMVLASAHVYPLFDTWLDWILQPFERDEVALSYGRQVGDHRTKYSEARVLLKWFPETSSASQDHDFCNNANAAIRRSVWRANPYDEGLTGLEDLAWAGATRGQGWQISYVAEAQVVHVHEESWISTVNRYRREAIAYRNIVGAKPVRLPDALTLASRNIASDLTHARRDGVLVGNVSEIFKFRSAQFYGAYQGSNDPLRPDKSLRERFYYPLPLARAGARASDPGRRIEYAKGTPE